MDFIRSCYETNFLFYPGSPVVPVRWYFAPRGATIFPGVNEFVSANWDDTKGDSGFLGEQGGPRPWNSGTTPRFMLGKEVCDPIEWFRIGQPPVLLGKPATRGGVPICCTDLCKDSGLTIDGDRYIYTACGGLQFDHGVKQV